MRAKLNIRRALRRAGLAAAIMLTAGTWTPAAAHGGRPPVLLSPELVASADRLDRIGARLKQANAEVCAAAPMGCGGRLIVLPNGALNAWADGRNIRVTQKMMQFARLDDELAFVVAHELAHNLLGHAALLRSTTALFGAQSKDLAERSQDMEFAADALAVTLLAKAGFDLEASAPFIARSMRGRSGGAHSHPDSANRVEAIRVAVLQQAEGLL